MGSVVGDSVHNKNEYYEWINSLKGIAIVGVVLIHSGGANLPGYSGLIGKAGLHGVQMFTCCPAF